LRAPDEQTLKGRRDRAILAILLGCGLRRAEVAKLQIRDVQQREDHRALSRAPGMITPVRCERCDAISAAMCWRVGRRRVPAPNVLLNESRSSENAQP
jgi:integrase